MNINIICIIIRELYLHHNIKRIGFSMTILVNEMTVILVR